jgi:hypothetical protein
VVFVFYVGKIKLYEFYGCHIYTKHHSRDKLSESENHITTNHKFIFIKVSIYHICVYVCYEIIKKQGAKFSASLDMPP